MKTKMWKKRKFEIHPAVWNYTRHKNDKLIKKSMALKKTVSLSIYDKSAWKIKGKNGKSYQGVNYEGFDKDNRVVRFTSKKEEYPVFDCSEYNESNARDFVLYGKSSLEGGVKWRDYEDEKKLLDKDFSQSELDENEEKL